MRSDEESNKKKRKRRKKSPIATFFKTMLSIVLIFVVVSGVGIFAYNKFFVKEKPTDKNTSQNNNSFIDSIMGKGIKLNVAIFGTDLGGTRTDVIFVVHFDSKAKKLGLISVPRDTRVTMTNDMQNMLDEDGRYYESTCKVNAVHAYGGDKGPEYAVLQLEDLLEIKIDNYVEMDFEGFKQIIDVIGGVDFNVPQNMKHYDPDPDLNINLKAGMQHLSGAEAVQLVRFRSYPEGDVARVEAQQAFLKALAEKVLSSETILGNLPSLITTAFQYVKTDLTLVDAIKYSRYINDISLDNISMELLPGVGQYVNDISYYIHDEVETRTVVDRVFFGTNEATTDTLIDSKEMSIEVANGGTVSGLAGIKSDLLKEEGFNVTSISTFNGEKSENTRIVVKSKGMGEDLISYFPGSAVEIDDGILSPDVDIKIILGTSER